MEDRRRRAYACSGYGEEVSELREPRSNLFMLCNLDFFGSLYKIPEAYGLKNHILEFHT